ncbi:hypothetical protein [Usitatibacter palustris]|uniref:Uncharacterized protein n=1 Tax=Usitatibacter palustris TaxID=2732487 RepID=A0A6M4H591_9PROT|nr:hypothetical protein [Usitatibacter palustris]QJR14776.1 hypothetical protein DSM104440_01586 [Usitatibacter palustris]
MRVILAALIVAPAFAWAQADELVDPCTLLTSEEVASFVGVDAQSIKTTKNTTAKGRECLFTGKGQKSLMVLEVRRAKYGKSELDSEAESLQKIYRTTVVPVAGVGDIGFWLPARRELWFYKAKTIGRIAMAGATGDAKAIEAKTQSVGRMIEGRLK